MVCLPFQLQNLYQPILILEDLIMQGPGKIRNLYKTITVWIWAVRSLVNTGGSRIRTENLQSQDIPFSREWSIKGILSLWLQRSEDFFIYFTSRQRLLRLAALNLYLQMYFTRTEGETPATGWAAEGRNLNKSRTLDCTLGMVSCVKWDHTGCIEWVRIHIRRDL